MGNNVTITAHTADDPYSAFWADVPSAQLADIEQLFTGSDYWSLSTDPLHVRTAELLAYVEEGNQPPRLYLTTDSTAVDLAADKVERILGRGPDSLS